MTRVWTLLGVAALVAAPAAAQIAGMPVWNSPKGGTGLTINGDFGKPSSAPNGAGGTAFGGRAELGLGTLTISAGAATYKPENASESILGLGADAAFRVVGGSLVPVNINVQAGVGRTDSTANGPAVTTITGAVGVSVTLPTPGFSIEPYFSPGIRHASAGGTSNSDFGFAIGANVGLGMIGFHLAYDYTKLSSSQGGGHLATIGLGAHIGLHVPLGM